jgi:phosphoglycolate phosphatase
MLNKMENSVKAVVFDLDGTLIDSAPDICASVNKMLASEGITPLDLATVTSFIGEGLPKLVERVILHVDMPLARHQDLTAKTLAIYNETPSDLTQPYDGVRACLDLLKFEGYRLAICTNKPFAITNNVLRELDFLPYFDTIVGADTLAVKKPNPAPLHYCIKELGADQTLYVGDSEIDYKTAINAHIPFALFTGGYRKEGLLYFKNAREFDTFKDLPKLIRTHFN